MTPFWIFVTVLFAGIITVSTTNRIVGGQPATVERYPSIVQVEFLSQITNVWSHRCGGSILTTKYVLSAAQCFAGWSSDSALRRIRAGATYRHIGGVIIYVKSAIRHPSYGSNGMEGDISVVVLENRLVYSTTIKQATIAAHSTMIPDNLPVILAGWGRIGPSAAHSEVLRDVTVFTINNEVCKDRYSKAWVPLNVTENMICAGILDIGGRDACHEDSGGPMYFGNIIIGIISGGYSCANGTWPGINTALASYTNWIIETAI